MEGVEEEFVDGEVEELLSSVVSFGLSTTLGYETPEMRGFSNDKQHGVSARSNALVLEREIANEETSRLKGVTRAAVSELTSEARSVGEITRPLKSMLAVGMAGAGVIVAGTLPSFSQFPIVHMSHLELTKVSYPTCRNRRVGDCGAR